MAENQVRLLVGSIPVECYKRFEVDHHLHIVNRERERGEEENSSSRSLSSVCFWAVFQRREVNMVTRAPSRVVRVAADSSGILRDRWVIIKIAHSRRWKIRFPINAKYGVVMKCGEMAIQVNFFSSRHVDSWSALCGETAAHQLQASGSRSRPTAKRAASPLENRPKQSERYRNTCWVLSLAPLCVPPQQHAGT